MKNFSCIIVGSGDFRRHVPVYPIRIRNVLNTIKSINDKTKNSLESWRIVLGFEIFLNKLLENLRFVRMHMYTVAACFFQGIRSRSVP